MPVDITGRRVISRRYYLLTASRITCVAKKILSHFDVELSREKFRESVVLPCSHTITEDEPPGQMS